MHLFFLLSKNLAVLSVSIPDLQGHHKGTIYFCIVQVFLSFFCEEFVLKFFRGFTFHSSYTASTRRLLLVPAPPVLW